MASKPMPPTGPGKVSKRKPWIRNFFIFLLLFIVLTIGLKKCGLNVVGRTENEELIDKPHAPDRR